MNWVNIHYKQPFSPKFDEIAISSSISLTSTPKKITKKGPNTFLSKIDKGPNPYTPKNDKGSNPSPQKNYKGPKPHTLNNNKEPSVIGNISNIIFYLLKLYKRILILMRLKVKEKVTMIEQFML